MKRVSACWVRRMLTDEENQNLVDVCTDLLCRLQAQPEIFLHRIVTQDETWVHHFDLETKRQSMVWKHVSYDNPKKFKVILSAGKVRATVFGTVKVWWWQIICQKALQLQAYIMLMNYVNYAKQWKKSVEESCDVEFFCSMITRLPTPPLLHLLRLNVATNYYLIHHILQI